MKLLKSLSVAFSILFVSAILVSCTSKGNKESKLEKIKKENTIVLGTSADYIPYEFPIINNDGTESIVGFDVLIAKEIAKDLGVNLTIKNLDFNGLLDALNSNNVDFIMSGINPTEERKQSIDFSKTYYEAKNVLLVKKNKVDSIKSINDLKDLTVGVQLGSIQDKLAQEKLKNSSIKSLIRIPELILELSSGKVDAIVTETPVAEQYIRTNPDLAIVYIDEFNQNLDMGSAIGIKKGEPDLVNAINSTIDRLLKDNKITEFFNEALDLAKNINQK